MFQFVPLPLTVKYAIYTISEWAFYTLSCTYHHQGPVCWRRVLVWSLHLNFHWGKKKLDWNTQWSDLISFLHTLMYPPPNNSERLWRWNGVSHLWKQSCATRLRPQLRGTKAAPSLWTGTDCPPRLWPLHRYPAENPSRYAPSFL